MKKTIHIIEPTLQDETGHCCGYVTALIEASMNSNVQLELWVGNNAKNLFGDQVKKYCFFKRRLRRLQVLFLYYYLLKKDAIIFIPTAGQFDLVILAWLSKKIRKKHNKIFLHFHQYKIKDKKIRILKKIASENPDFHILAPTGKLLSVFSSNGFKNCHLVPCPSHTRTNTKINTSGTLKYLLYAGAARQDKGFMLLVKLIQYLNQIQSKIPVVVQISPNHVGRYDSNTLIAIDELKKCSYPFLTIHETSLDKDAYLNLFENAICLQLYDNNVYRDKFSGVTLDALYAACPVLTTSGTWISEVVNRFHAGAVVLNTDPQNVYLEIEKIADDFQNMQKNALCAGKVLRDEHNPLTTLQIIDNAS